MRKIIILSIAVLFSVVGMTQSISHEAKIRQLLELTGSAKIGVQVINQLKPLLMKSNPEVDTKFWDEFMSEIKPDELIDLIIPLYQKYYTDEDIDNMIIFYNSSTGKKAISVMPQLMQESMKIGQAWGFEISQRAINKLKLKGYKK